MHPAMYNDNKVELIPIMQSWYKIWKSVHVIYHINRIEVNPYDDLKRWSKSICWSYKPVHDKILDELKIKRNFIYLIKDFFFKSQLMVKYGTEMSTIITSV